MDSTGPIATDATNGDEDENTVVVDRAGLKPARARDPETKATGHHEDEMTVVVDRAAAKPPRAKNTRAKATGHEEDDRTIVVKKSARTGAGSAKPRTTRKRGVGPAPVPIDFTPPAVKGAGPDATERYRPRAVPAPHSQVPAMEAERAASREPSATMPSVARHARITARAAVAVFVVSCVASIVGLTLIALALHARR